MHYHNALSPLLVNLEGVGIIDDATQPTNATNNGDNHPQEDANTRSPEVPALHSRLLQSQPDD